MTKRIAIGLLLLLMGCIPTAAFAEAAAWEFGRQIVHPNVPGADEVACGDIDDCRSADFNGDGRDDIVIQKYHGEGVYLVACPAPADPRQSTSWQSRAIGKGGKGLCLAGVDGDRRLDVLVDNRWLTNPGKPFRDNWPSHAITNAPDGVKNAAGDLNGDGRTDVVLSSEEGRGIWWFEAPADPVQGKWIRRTLRDDSVGNHSLWLADFDLDGHIDILTAEMHTEGKHRIVVFENADGKGGKWIEHVIAATGSHNALAADVDGDGRPDIVGCNFAGSANPLEVWYNQVR